MSVTRTMSAVLAGATLVVGAAACSSTGNTAAKVTSPANAKPQVRLATLSGVDTEVAVDAKALAALKSLGVTVGTTGSAKLVTTYGPTLAFPITGGTASVYDKAKVSPYVTGHIDHNGSGLQFSKGAVKLAVSDFVVNPGTSMLTASVGGKAGFPLFVLDGTNLKITKDSAGHAKLDGTKVELTAEAAAALDKTFGVTAFTPRFLIGVAHITAA